MYETRGRYRQDPEDTDRRLAKWLPKSKVGSFLTLMDRMRSELGTHRESLDYAGISSGTHSRMKQGKLSAVNARRILDAYNKLEKLG